MNNKSWKLLDLNLSELQLNLSNNGLYMYVGKRVAVRLEVLFCTVKPQVVVKAKALQ